MSDVEEEESAATACEEVGTAGERGRLTTVLSNGRPEADRVLSLAADLRFSSMRAGFVDENMALAKGGDQPRRSLTELTAIESNPDANAARSALFLPSGVRR